MEMLSCSLDSIFCHTEPGSTVLLAFLSMNGLPRQPSMCLEGVTSMSEHSAKHAFVTNMYIQIWRKMSLGSCVTLSPVLKTHINFKKKSSWSNN